MCVRRVFSLLAFRLFSLLKPEKKGNLEMFGFAEGFRRERSEFAKKRCKVTLIFETSLNADFDERQFAFR